MSTTPQQPQQPQQSQQSAAVAPSSVTANAAPQSMTVRHQHMADPSSNRMKGGAPVSPYLIQHPAFPNGVPGTASAGAPVTPVDAGLPTPEEQPPPVLHDMGLKVLSKLGDNAIGRVSAKMKKAEWESNYAPEFGNKPLTGVNAISPYGTALSRMSNKLVDPVAHPNISSGLNWALKIGLGPMLANKTDPYANMGNPNHAFNQRLQTNRMFLNSGDSVGDNPLAKLLGGVTRAALGDGNVEDLKSVVSGQGGEMAQDAWNKMTGK